MDPNKRGNPPFEPSSYAAGLERRVKRHVEWAEEARAQAHLMLYGNDAQQASARQWWADWLNQPNLVASNA